MDGYSRLPVYCKCSFNNRAETVLACFRDAIERLVIYTRFVDYGVSLALRAIAIGFQISPSLKLITIDEVF